MKCHEAQELVAAYALGALSPREMERVEGHAERCAQCASELREAMEAAGVLALVVPQQAPPLYLRARIIHQVRSERRPEARPFWRLPQGWRLAAAGVVGVGLAALLGTTLFLSLRVSDLQDQSQELEQMALAQEEESGRLAVALDEQRALGYLMTIPNKIVYTSKDSPMIPTARGMVMATPDKRWGFLVSEGLEALPEGQGYQAWWITNDRRISAGLFTADEYGWAQLLLDPLHPEGKVMGIGITVEPDTGSSAPTTPDVLVVEMDEEE